jgi:hypothetical protein
LPFTASAASNRDEDGVGTTMIGTTSDIASQIPRTPMRSGIGLVANGSVEHLAEAVGRRGHDSKRFSAAIRQRDKFRGFVLLGWRF